jgi:hypothetical protein
MAGCPRGGIAVRLKPTLAVLGTVLGICTLLFSGLQFLRTQSVEAAKPYLERKLKWCEEAVEGAAAIATATSRDPDVVVRFWQLYWGVMGMVENDDVTKAMIAFGRGLDASAKPSELQGLSLALAHACRAEMASSWSPLWRRARSPSN